MKKCVFLHLFLLLMAFQLTANSPGGKASGKPLPKSTLPLKSLISDWGAVPGLTSQPDSMQDEQEAEMQKEAQRFSFPATNKS